MSDHYDPMVRGEATVVIAVPPTGWAGDWHENPAATVQLHRGPVEERCALS